MSIIIAEKKEDCCAKKDAQKDVEKGGTYVPPYVPDQNRTDAPASGGRRSIH